MAEAAYPTQREVERSSNRQVEALIPIARQWWCGSFDGVLIPYAITKGAVSYYLKVTEELRQAGKRNPLYPKMTSSQFGYKASVSRQEKYSLGDSVFKNVYIVKMGMMWRQYCGPLCAMAFGASRTVVLSEDGRVLTIEEDQCAPTVVS
jgi:hypothetical protein